ncbi:GH25 family lysozyme [Kitasatospora sp. NPDC059673]|uniref:GH25 family lysozyme n=1 Tax=Kitasatospora sp. NPDC059673 TaxID=3346901 RepID=UPI0036BC1F9C
MLKGIDVSSYQPAALSTNGLSFAFVKATEGTDYVNPKQAAQSQSARGSGLVVGFYHFLRPGDVQTQAQCFVERCLSLPNDILACDWEAEGGTAPTCAEKDQFLAAVKQLRPNHRIVLYCDVDFWHNRDSTSNCGDGLWIADYSHPAGQPAVQHQWLFHQYSQAPVDQSVANFETAGQLRQWAGQ